MEEATKLTEKQQELIKYIRDNVNKEGLNLMGKDITDEDLVIIAPEIEKMKNLKKLNLCSNKIKSIIGLKNLHNLTLLNLSGNQISSISNFGLPNLQELYVGSNKITSIDNLECPNIRTLNLTDNQISSISNFGLPNLQELYVGGNKVISIDNLECPNIHLLDVSRNKITSYNDVTLKHNAKVNIQNNFFNSPWSNDAVNTINKELYKKIDTQGYKVASNIRDKAPIDNSYYDIFLTSINPEHNVDIIKIINSSEGLFYGFSQMPILHIAERAPNGITQQEWSKGQEGRDAKKKRTINEIKDLLELAVKSNDLQIAIKLSSDASKINCDATSLFEKIKTDYYIKQSPEFNEKQKFDVFVDNFILNKIRNALSRIQIPGDPYLNESILFNEVALAINKDTFFNIELRQDVICCDPNCSTLEVVKDYSKPGVVKDCFTQDCVNRSYKLLHLVTQDFAMDDTEMIELKDKDGKSIGTFIDFKNIKFDRDKIVLSCIAENIEHFTALTTEANAMCINCHEKYEIILSLLLQKKYLEQLISTENTLSKPSSGVRQPDWMICLTDKLKFVNNRMTALLQAKPDIIANKTQETPSNTGKSLSNQKEI